MPLPLSLQKKKEFKTKGQSLFTCNFVTDQFVLCCVSYGYVTFCPTPPIALPMSSSPYSPPQILCHLTTGAQRWSYVQINSPHLRREENDKEIQRLDGCRVGKTRRKRNSLEMREWVQTLWENSDLFFKIQLVSVGRFCEQWGIKGCFLHPLPSPSSSSSSSLFLPLDTPLLSH